MDLTKFANMWPAIGYWAEVLAMGTKQSLRDWKYAKRCVKTEAKKEVRQ